MKTFLSVLALISCLSVVNCVPIEQTENGQDNTVHVFVLMVPESAVESLKKARQEEEAVAAGLEITETGAYVGQIISGVLGGDVRPIFAGSASFIEEPDVQQGVSTILANVAPSLNMWLRQWFNRVQTTLGITTVRPANATVSSNGVIANGQPQAPQPVQSGQPLQSQSQSSFQQRAPAAAGSNVYQYQPNGDHLFETTTVEPLPLIKFKPASTDDNEDNESDARVKIVE